MKEGNIVKGIVENIKPYGVFVSVLDYIGLIHIKEVSNGYIDDINRFFDIGEEINVYILKVDESSKRLELSYKRACFDDLDVARRYKIKKGFLPLNRMINKWINEYEGDNYEEVDS